MTQRLSSSAILALAFLSVQCGRVPHPQEEASNQYVNPRVCASCHADIYAHYLRTGMARAFYRPSSDSFPNTRPFFHRPSRTWFQMVAKGAGWVERSWQVFDGKEESSQDLTVDYVMGSGNHARTYLHRTPRNTLIELPLAWYAENGGAWAMNPGFDTAHLPVARKTGYDCMFCHNAYPQIPAGHNEAGVEPVFPANLPEGIDCQRCHGPGGNHVRAAQAPHPNAGDVKKEIVNPARLSASLRMDVCRQCHLETTSAPLPNSIRRFDRGPFSYRPREPLSTFQLLFDHAPGTGHDDKFEIVSSAYRLQKSPCFLQSKGALSCTTCHNPHDIPHGPSAADHYNGVCRQCHAVVQAKNHSAKQNCIGCHMPKRRTEDVVHAVMTDHFIQRRSAPGLLAEFPERHEATGYRGEVVPYGDADELYSAVAQVSAKSNLTAGLPRLESAMAQRAPSNAAFYVELGDAYADTNQFAKAVDPYRRALARRPGSAMILRRLANADRASGQAQQALEALVQATQSEPSDAEAWYDLGMLQSDLGRKPEALDSLRKALALNPEFADAQNSTGAILAETGQPDAAESAFRAALRLQPSLAAAHSNLANLLAAKNQFAEAVWHYQQGGDKAPDQFNFGIALARMNRLADAEAHIEAALKADPSLAVAHDVLGGLLENRGRIDAALEEYREAVRLRPDFGKAHLDLGTVLANRHDRAGAVEEFRKASADSDPEIRQQARQALRAVSNH